MNPSSQYRQTFSAMGSGDENVGSICLTLSQMIQNRRFQQKLEARRA
jgi:hypothetical protein